MKKKIFFAVFIPYFLLLIVIFGVYFGYRSSYSLSVTETTLRDAFNIVKEESVKAEDPIIAPKMESKLEMKIMDYSYQADNVEQTLRNIQQLNQWLATYPDALKTMLIKI